MKRRGTRGHLTKDEALEGIVEAVHGVARGKERQPARLRRTASTSSRRRPATWEMPLWAMVTP